MITQFKQKNLMEFHPDKSKYINTFKNEEKIILGNNELKQTQSQEYLGDVISADGRLKETIELRSKSCTATVAELNAIIEETVSENILIDAVITYHNSIIIPKLCLNSETWILNNTDLQEMEAIQNKSLKRMLRLPQGTPSKGLRAELGICSIESVITKRKLRFLHRLLNFPDKNITKKVLLQQLNLPGDTWLSTTLSTCQKLGLSDDLETIKITPKLTWKKVVNEAIACNETEKVKEWAVNSKKYTSIALNVKKKSYIHYLPPTIAVTILKARTGMTEVKNNYKNMWPDLKCRKCINHIEDISHVLKCNKTLSEADHKLVSEAKYVLDNVETEEPSKVLNLGRMIFKEMKLLAGSSLESAPPTLAHSDELDTI